jgi:hypothetical protein
MAGAQRVQVTFIKPYLPYQPGDVAVFSEAKAEQLAAVGVAEIAGDIATAEMPAAARAAEASDAAAAASDAGAADTADLLDDRKTNKSK